MNAIEKILEVLGNKIAELESTISYKEWEIETLKKQLEEAQKDA